MLKNYCCGPEKWRYFNLEEKWWFVHIEGLLDNLVNISLVSSSSLAVILKILILNAFAFVFLTAWFLVTVIYQNI